MISTFPNGPSYTYKPADPAPGDQNWEAMQCRQKGAELSGAAQRAADFFSRADNGCADLDPRDGFVRLRNAAAPGLLEQDTQLVSGVRTPDGDLAVDGGGYYTMGASTLTVSNNGTEISMERPMYSNNMYGPTLEQLSVNEDGTHTVSWIYARQ